MRQAQVMYVCIERSHYSSKESNIHVQAEVGFYLTNLCMKQCDPAV